MTLNGTASGDADGDPVRYAWTGPFGTTAVVFTAVDAAGISASATTPLTVFEGAGGTGSKLPVVVGILAVTGVFVAILFF